MSSDLLASNDSLTQARFVGTTPDTGFSDSSALDAQDIRWKRVMDKLLEWGKASSEESSCPMNPLIRSALDFAVDCRHLRLGAPTCVYRNDDDEIAFTWGSGGSVITIEVVDSGLAEYTEFRAGRVVREEMLLRDPRTRKLEIREQVR